MRHAAGPRPDPGGRRRLRRGSAGQRRARAALPHRRRGADRRRPRLGPRHRQGRGRRAARRRDCGPGRSALPRSARSRSQAVREPSAADGRPRRLVVIERALAPGSGGIVTADVRAALAADGRAPHAGGPSSPRSSPASAAARSPGTRCGRCSPAPPRRPAPVQLPRPAVRPGRVGAGADARGPPVRPERGEHAPPPRRHGAGSVRASHDTERVSSTRPAASRPGTGCCRRPAQRTVEPRRANTLTCGHRACQGCGEALGARYALDAVMRATKGKLIAVNATGCLEVFSTPFPERPGRSPGCTRCSATPPRSPPGWPRP